MHIANGVDVDQAAEAASLPEAPGTPSEGEEASISKLLGALRSHTDKHAAVQAAFKAVMQTPQLLVGLWLSCPGFSPAVSVSGPCSSSIRAAWPDCKCKHFGVM